MWKQCTLERRREQPMNPERRRRPDEMTNSIAQRMISSGVVTLFAGRSDVAALVAICAA
jgi:hypothetical protein